EAQDFHRKHNSRGTGAVYQSRYAARELDDARKYFGAVRYVEQNPVKDGYVTRAQDWPWCSAWDGEGGPQLFVADPPPIPYLPNWDEILNDLGEYAENALPLLDGAKCDPGVRPGGGAAVLDDGGGGELVQDGHVDADVAGDRGQILDDGIGQPPPLEPLPS